MTKKSFWDNSSLQQDIKWDNQELPGCPDEVLLTKNWNKVDAARNRSKDPNWIEANTRRLNDPKYIKRLSESITQFYKDNPEFQKEKVKTDKWKQSHKEGVDNYVNSSDYVNPRGMLGKRHSEESKQKQSKIHSGKIKPLEGNAKISQFRKGKKPKQESIEKMREKLLGRETNRSRKVQTPAGDFNKIKEAAEYYEVSTGSIKNFISGQNVKEWFKPHLESKGVKFDGLKPLGFSWLGNVHEELGAKKIHTPDGIFDDVKIAAEFYKITPTAIRHRIKSPNFPEYYIIE